MLFGGTALAQIDANRICLQNGSEFYVNGPFYGYPNHGAGKYFPSFAHWASTPVDKGGFYIYPWKIAGWSWGGMQANIGGPIWYWETCLQSSTDNPYASTMSFDYPALFCTGAVPHTGFPQPIYGGTIPSSVPVVGANQWIFPSSSGGFDAYLNIFAVGGASWNLPSTTPFIGWQFAFAWDCASAITIPSSDSIWEATWNMKGPNPQYTLLSGDEVDCLGGGGNKGRNYSIISDTDNGYLWCWLNGCTGIAQEWAMCIFVCDTVSIPVNVPGDPDVNNPFSAYGFDVGVPCLCPLLSSNCVSLGFMTEEYTGTNGGFIALASFAFWPTIKDYNKKHYRVPHGYDVLTGTFIQIAGLFMHFTTSGYPACMFGTTTGGNSLFFPFPGDPALLCAEIRWSTYDMGKGRPMSASFMATYF
jgi:hypothetical protein